MNKQIRKVAYAMLVMFGVLFLNLNWLQLVRAEKLANHPANRRLLLKEYAIERGFILSADDRTLTMSQPTPQANLKYLRTYESGALFAHITGYYSIRFGRDRLERTYNRELTGEGGVITMQDLGDRLFGEGEKGDTLVLSVDSRVQQAATEALGAHRGAIVALDPASGQILAMVSLPSFDPNPLSQHDAAAQEQTWKALNSDPAKPLLNRASSATFPPGSTFKLITAATALENGRGIDTSYPAAQGFTPPQTDKEINNFGGSTCGGNMADALKVSCNTYFARLGADLGGEKLGDTARRFGFTETPPLDIRAVPSKLPTDQQLRSPAFSALSAIGQHDVSATPLQMALVAAGIANGGKVPEPRLVKEIRDVRGDVVHQTEPKIWKEAVSAQTADALRSMMITAVESGTGTRAQIPGVRIAGKTGTAQVGVAGSDTLSWFVAFAPADAPRIAIAVMVEGAGDPRNETGGRLAAPIAKKVLEAHRVVAGW